MNKVSVEECRACLKKIEEEICQELFGGWYTPDPPPWAIPGVLIAHDLANIADIEISENDKYSKVICSECYNRLADACSFVVMVQNSDAILRKRVDNSTITETETTTWPKPILLNKSLNGDINNTVQVEIKQEMLSDDEQGTNYMDQVWEPQMDIKIEPEELVAPICPPTPEINVNGAFSLSGTSEEAIHQNGTIKYSEEEYLDNTIKQEALSEDETDTLPDLSLDCILCMKVFSSVTGLKAHVIAQHSYGTVERQTESDVSPAPAVKEEPDKYVCATCRQSFATRTDLMVHETCHNKHVCFVCGAKFNTFRQLSRHGARCRPAHAPRLLGARRLPRSRQLSPKTNSTPSTAEQKDKAVQKQLQTEPSAGDNNTNSDPTENPHSTLKIINTDDLINHTPVSTACNSLQILSINHPGSHSQPTTPDVTEESSQHAVFPNSLHIGQNNPDTTEEDVYILPNILDSEEIKVLNESSVKQELEDSSSHDLDGNSNLSEETSQHSDNVNQRMEVHLEINPIMEKDSVNSVTKMEVEDIVQVKSENLESKLVGIRSESDEITP